MNRPRPEPASDVPRSIHSVLLCPLDFLPPDVPLCLPNPGIPFCPAPSLTQHHDFMPPQHRLSTPLPQIRDLERLVHLSLLELGDARLQRDKGRKGSGGGERQIIERRQL